MATAHSTGHNPDHPEVVKKRLGVHLLPDYHAIRATPLPLKTANRQNLWRIWNQHDVRGCEGCAHSSAMTLRLAIAGTPLPEPISNVGFYLGALMCDETPGPDGTL